MRNRLRQPHHCQKFSWQSGRGVEERILHEFFLWQNLFYYILLRVRWPLVARQQNLQR